MDFINSENIGLLLATLGAGVLASYVAGLFGIGGGVVLVPALLTILPYFGASHDIVMHAAVGTTLSLNAPATLMAARKQYQLGNLELNLFRFWIGPVLGGVVLGAFLINYFSTEILKIFFTVYLILVTLVGVFEKNKSRIGEGYPKGWGKYPVGFLIGTTSVLLGIGGGSFTVPYLKFWDYPLKKAIALSTATSFFIGLSGAIGLILDGWGKVGRPPFSLGYVFLPAFLLLTPVAMLISPWGARSAHALSERTLKWLFTGFLGLMTAYMLIRLFWVS